MKNIVKITILIASIAGMSNTNTSILDKAARLYADNMFKNAFNQGFSFLRGDNREVLEIAMASQMVSLVAGSISAFVAFLATCYTVKRVISDNAEENRIWKACKTITGFLSSIGFSTATTAAIFFYKVSENVQHDYTNITNYSLTLARLGLKEMFSR
jgi:hypothetical protein